MKKILLGIGMLTAVSSMLAIGPDYDTNNYEALPVQVNTASDEFGMSAYKDNSVVYFRTDSTSSKDGMENVQVLKATILPTGELSEPEECTELKNLGVCGRFAYDAAADKIYFSKYNKRSRSYQLYESTYAGDEWLDPQPVTIKNITPSRMNMSIVENANWDYIDPGSSIVQPFLAKDGSRIYFVSNMKKGSVGKTDIWYTDREDDGTTWGAPVNLGDSVNTKGNDQYPFVLGDSILYYASDAAADGRGGYDLRVARLNDSVPTETELLGELFNTGANDYNLINVNGQVYFISEREDGKKEDIIYLSPLAKPEVIELLAVEPVAAPAAEIEPEFHHVLFYFDFDKSNMKDGSNKELEDLLNEMKLFPDRRFEIAGHTDERGSDAYNDRLSVRRANAVRDALVKNGIDKNMLVVKGYGKRQPVVPDAKSDEDHAQNRRVEINFYNEK